MGNVVISSYVDRNEGSTVTFHCSDGFVPVGEMMSTCSLVPRPYLSVFQCCTLKNERGPGI